MLDAALSPEDREVLLDICASVDNAATRMLDILIAVQDRFHWISPGAMELIAERTGISRIEVEGVASFYSFLSLAPKGRVTIRLCDDIIDRFAGLEAVTEAFEEAFGIAVGETSDDGAVSLEYTPCIGLCDQAPAAMINDLVATKLTPDRARQIAKAIKAGQSPEDILLGPANGLAPYDRATGLVDNNIRHAGALLLGPVPDDAGLTAALDMSPDQILRVVEASGLRGCGGAGFPAGTKWRAAAQTEADHRVVICNADEGEPGTFKDRVLLTERADLMIEGMTLCARAIGANEGLIYLRGEYAYLRPHLEAVLAERRRSGRLGSAIMGVDGFDFDIRIQLGAGSYVCGADRALISSCEGLPGEPRTLPPYPTTRGYLGFPTIVNNVETFSHAARILDIGADRFRDLGTEKSPGTKLFSVAGDCLNPGVYELPYGLTVQELLDTVGADDAQAVLMGGPSGEMIARDAFHRRLGFEDLPTGGAVIVFNGERNILEIVEYYMSFFVHESCGHCTPCRVGNVFLLKAIGKLRAGLANAADLDDLRDLSQTIIETSRCGLGTTSPNPILSTLDNFPLVYAASIKPSKDRLQASFDIQSAIDRARKLAQRRSYIFDQDFGA